MSFLPDEGAVELEAGGNGAGAGAPESGAVSVGGIGGVTGVSGTGLGVTGGVSAGGWLPSVGLFALGTVGSICGSLFVNILKCLRSSYRVFS